MSRVARLLVSAVAVSATAMGMTLVGAAPAQAHGSCTGLGNLGFACVEAGHHHVTVGDGRCDDMEVRADLRFANGTTGSLTDPDGCGGGVGSRTFERTVAQYRFCAVGAGCTSWHQA